MIRIEKLTKGYRDCEVLRNLSFHLEPGEFAFLQGKSGSGKSTLLKLLYREIEGFTGEIEIDSTPIGNLPKYQLRRKIGIIFQSFELLNRKTVLENVMLAGEVIGRNTKEIESDAHRLLERVGLKEKERKYPHQLSGGEQQRVAIVRALLNKPRLLLADEPTGNLDTETALEMLQLMRELHEEEEISMLIVTHSEQVLKAFPSKIWVMEDRQVHEASKD